MRLITTITHEQKRAKVYRSEGEYVVRFYDHATYNAEADYFTDDLADAKCTAEIQLGLRSLQPL